MSYQDFMNEPPEDQSFLKRNRVAIIVSVVVLILVGIAVPMIMKFGKVPPPHKPEEIVIHLQPPPPMPPPPPPPPPPPSPPQQKMVEQPKDLKPLDKPKDVTKTPDMPKGPPSPPSSGPPSDFGLGGGGGNGGGGDGGGGSQFGPYAAELQARIAAALRENDKTKDARLHIKVRIWVNNTGNVTRASLAGSSGDPSLDEALKNEVLTGLNLPEAPPSDMPMPIVMMINESRPN